MPEKSHSPYDGAAERHARGMNRSLELESERARLAAGVLMRQNQRHNRLLVGGRAHVRKHGLS